MKLAIPFALALSLLAPPAFAAEVGAEVTLALPADAELRRIQYECDEIDDNLTVTYVNAAPNFLSILPFDGESRIFVAVMSGSGVRYASGEHVWSTSGADASLTSERSEDGAALLTCLEVNEIP